MTLLVPPNSEKASAVVRNIAADREVGEKPDIVPGRDDGGKGHKVDSCHCLNKDAVDEMIWKLMGVSRN